MERMNEGPGTSSERDPARTGARGVSRADTSAQESDAPSASNRRRRGDRRASVRRRQATWNRLLLLAAVVAALVTLPRYFLSRPEGTEVDRTPDELFGTWVTDDPRYAGRSLTIDADHVTLGVGAGEQAAHRILSIRVESAPVNREYLITYESPEGEQRLEVFVYNDGLLRLRNPSEVLWRRQAEGDRSLN